MRRSRSARAARNSRMEWKSRSPRRRKRSRDLKPMTELCFQDAVELAGMIRAREVSASEGLAAFLSQIERVNPKVNAICSFIGEDAALRAAKKADEKLAGGGAVGPL